MRKVIRILLLVPFLIINLELFAQTDDLEALLDNEMKKTDTIEYSYATFKSTRIINGHSIERMHKNELDFRISHRFGKLNNGWRELFGLDESSSHFGLEYGVTDWLMLGMGRASYKKNFNGFMKLSLLRQRKGKRNIPVSVSYINSYMCNSTKYENPERDSDFNSRMSYMHQLLVARKFSNRFSLQLSPTYLHRNLVYSPEDLNDIFAMGIGGRFKITNRVSVNFEYFYVNNLKSIEYTNYYNPLSFGVDIETGSHVFQLHLTNSIAILENGFLGETTDSWKEGDIHFGFNISRVFSFKKK